MINLSTKIKLYAKANGVNSINFNKDVLLQDDRIDGVSSPYIQEWNVDGLVYGNIGDQLDEIFKNIDAWKARIQSIKDANPKE